MTPPGVDTSAGLSRKAVVPQQESSCEYRDSDTVRLSMRNEVQILYDQALSGSIASWTRNQVNLRSFHSGSVPTFRYPPEARIARRALFFASNAPKLSHSEAGQYHNGRVHLVPAGTTPCSPPASIIPSSPILDQTRRSLQP